jgi:hypothetical protein
MAWSMVGATALVCVALAVSAAWVFMTEPVAIAGSVDSPVGQSIAHALIIAALKIATAMRLL